MEGGAPPPPPPSPSSSSSGYFYPGIPAPRMGSHSSYVAAEAAGPEPPGPMTMGTAQDPLRGMTADAMAITPAVFDSQIEECIPQVGGCVVRCPTSLDLLSRAHKTTHHHTTPHHHRSPRCWRAPRWTGRRRRCDGTGGSSSRSWRSARLTSTWASRSTGSCGRRSATWRCPPGGACRRLRGCVALLCIINGGVGCVCCCGGAVVVVVGGGGDGGSGDSIPAHHHHAPYRSGNERT